MEDIDKAYCSGSATTHRTCLILAKVIQNKRNNCPKDDQKAIAALDERNTARSTHKARKACGEIGHYTAKHAADNPYEYADSKLCFRLFKYAVALL